MRLQLKNPWANRLHTLLQGRQFGSIDPAQRSPISEPSRRSESADWDEAFLRVESYLRAHQIESRVLLNQLTAEIISAARVLSEAHPDVPPVTVAMQVTHARIGDWLVRVLGEGHWADERFRARGRLALLLARLPQTSAPRFLSTDEVPADLAARLAGAALQPGPEVRLTGMPAAPLEFPLVDAAEETWTTFSGSTFVRASASWLLFVGFLGVAWLMIR